MKVNKLNYVLVNKWLKKQIRSWNKIKLLCFGVVLLSRYLYYLSGNYFRFFHLMYLHPKFNTRKIAFVLHTFRFFLKNQDFVFRADYFDWISSISRSIMKLHNWEIPCDWNPILNLSYSLLWSFMTNLKEQLIFYHFVLIVLNDHFYLQSIF